jgi:hypothetical protein
MSCACAACSHDITPASPTSTPTSTATIFGLTGQVVQAGTGTGIAAATVTLTDTLGNALTTTTNAAGAFAFDATLAAGTYTLQVSAPGYAASAAVMAIPVSSFTVQLPIAGTAPVTTLALVVTGQSTLTVGSSSQLTATLVYTDGTRKDVTGVATWASTVPNVATVSVSGLVTANSAGMTVVSAAFRDVTGSLVVTTSP